MAIGTKERIVAAKHFSAERYIRSTHPVLYISGRRDFQGTNKFRSDDAYGRISTVTGALWRPQGYNFANATDQIVVVNIYQTRISVEAWVRSSDITQDYRGIVVQPFTSAVAPFHEYGLSVEAAETPTMHVTTGGARSSATVSNSLNRWTHLTGVYDGANITLYANTIAGTPVAKTGNINDYGQVLTIGRYLTEASFEGTIGEVRIYDRALTAQEIQRNYVATRWRYQ